MHCGGYLAVKFLICHVLLPLNVESLAQKPCVFAINTSLQGTCGRPCFSIVKQDSSSNITLIIVISTFVAAVLCREVFCLQASICVS